MSGREPCKAAKAPSVTKRTTPALFVAAHRGVVAVNNPTTTVIVPTEVWLILSYPLGPPFEVLIAYRCICRVTVAVDLQPLAHSRCCAETLDSIKASEDVSLHHSRRRTAPHRALRQSSVALQCQQRAASCVGASAASVLCEPVWVACLEDRGAFTGH